MKRIDSPLTRALARHRLRRDWMAYRLGVGPWTFSRIEGGVQATPPDWYTRAAAILREVGADVSVDDLAWTPAQRAESLPSPEEPAAA